MLSNIVRLIHEFEKEHGIRPNLLYLNEFHAQHLRQSLSERYTLNSIHQLLGMEIVISREAIHPHVAWSHIVNKMAV